MKTLFGVLTSIAAVSLMGCPKGEDTDQATDDTGSGTSIIDNDGDGSAAEDDCNDEDQLSGSA